MKTKHRSGKPGSASALGAMSVLAILATALFAGCGGSGSGETSTAESGAATLNRSAAPGALPKSAKKPAPA